VIELWNDSGPKDHPKALPRRRLFRRRCPRMRATAEAAPLGDREKKKAIGEKKNNRKEGKDTNVKKGNMIEQR